MKTNSESAPSSYPAPKTQELSQLARKIQHGDNGYVRDEIRKNPRLLSASTDVPTILQEGFRYNALHVAARFGNAEAAQFILSTVTGNSYMEALYPDDPLQIRQQRTRYLTDMYLNTPDKGALETPLHFACKFGFYNVAKLLLGHPLCDESLRNRDLQTAEKVICSRASGSNATNKERIAKLFHETRIVPIWRDKSNDTAPLVGRPVNPKYLGQFTPKNFTFMFGDVTLDLFGPVDSSCIPMSRLGISWEIRAYAGPTDELTASEFYETMKSTATVTYAAQHKDSPMHSPDIRTLYSNGGPRTPTRRPIQIRPRQGIHGTPTSASLPSESMSKRDHAPQTPELKTPKDASSSSLLSPLEFRYTPQTLSLLLTSPVGFSSPGRLNPNRVLDDREIRLRDPEKGVERVGRKYATELGICWNEYWEFLGELTNLSSETGLVLLEDHLYRAREEQLEEERFRDNCIDEPTPVTAMCLKMEKMTLDSSEVSSTPTWPKFSPDWRNGLTAIKFQDASGERPSIQNGEAASLICLPPLEDESPKFKVAIRNLKLFASEDCEMDVNGHSPTSNERRSIPNSGGDTEGDWRNPLQSSLDESDANSDDDEFEDCQTYSVFINGSLPTKEDFQAMHAICDVIDNLSPVKYLQTTAWYNSLKATGFQK